ncbi:MAG TPA: diacylglycerol kinase family protein [Armatimonadota bacterium]|jgi:YegS/Rv2252/BmrU family lipid kinase
MSDETRRLIICNPHALHVSERAPRETVLHLLAQVGLEAEVVTAHDRQETRQLTERAVAEGYDQVVAAGGDGTINSVLQGLVGSAVPLGVLPLGTGNALARYLGVINMRQALATLAAGTARAIDLGQINDRYFAIMAGVGLSAQVSETLGYPTKRGLGRLSYLYHGMRIKADVPARRFRITFDGETGATLEQDLVEATVFNLPEQMFGSVKLLNAASGNDGVLEMLLVPDASAWGVLHDAGSALMGPARLDLLRGATVHRFTSAHLEVDPPWRWQTEGEVGGDTPVDISVHSGALRVLYSEG